MLPPCYNESRLAEKPMPPLVLVGNEHDNSVKSPIDEDSLDTSPIVFDQPSNLSQNSNSDDPVDINVNEEHSSTEMNTSNESLIGLNGNIEPNVDLNLSNNSLVDSNVDHIPVIIVNSNNENTTISESTDMAIVTTSNVSIITPSTSQQFAPANALPIALVSAMAIGKPIKQEPTFEELNETDDQTVNDLFEESYENYGSDDEVMVHRNAMLPKPLLDRNPYCVKVDDIVSGNFPFAENVSD